MPKIYAYQKASGALVAPALKADEEIKELCTVDGTTYVAVSDSVVFSKQPDAIKFAEVSGATLGSKLPETLKTIDAALPQTADIKAQIVAKIRERYSVEDEIKMLRISPSPESALWNDYVEQCLEWGRREKARLGMTKAVLSQQAEAESVEAKI